MSNALQLVDLAIVQASVVMYYLLRKNTKSALIKAIVPGRYKITIHKDGLSVFKMMLPIPGTYDVDYEAFGDPSPNIEITAKLTGSVDIVANWTFGPKIVEEMQNSYKSN
jgi:hypothetical protein